MKAVPVRSRIQIKNILLATDFSIAAANAMPFAGELARHFGASLFAVHAKTPENYALPTAEIWPATNAELQELTIDLRRNIHNRFPSVESEVLIAEGGVWGVLGTVAEEKNADLIVVGTSGRRGIGKFILGSAAEEILRRATCPVLTVGPHCSPSSPGEPSFRKILYATDFAESSPTAAEYAMGLAQENQAHLILLHVIEHPKAGELVHACDLEAGTLDRLRGIVPSDAELWSEPKAIVAHGNPAEKILEVAMSERADLIVLGVRNAKGYVRATHLPMAVAHQVVSRAICPVLTVRA